MTKGESQMVQLCSAEGRKARNLLHRHCLSRYLREARLVTGRVFLGVATVARLENPDVLGAVVAAAGLRAAGAAAFRMTGLSLNYRMGPRTTIRGLPA